MVKTINSKTTISNLLEGKQELVIAELVNLNNKFSKLKNPILRNVLARRITIADACKISGCTIQDFMTRMAQIGFIIDEEQYFEGQQPSDVSSPGKPDSYLELDVRPILAQSKHPLKEILAAIKKLKQGQVLKLINTFQPLPLINLLTGKGFSHRVEIVDENTVITYFNKTTLTVEDAVLSPSEEPSNDDQQFDELLTTFAPEKISYLDVRQLEMPKPMLTIMEQTPKLNAGDALFVYHKKIPVYLLPELEKQGLSYTFKTIGPGNVNMLIYKK